MIANTELSEAQEGVLSTAVRKAVIKAVNAETKIENVAHNLPLDTHKSSLRVLAREGYVDKNLRNLTTKGKRAGYRVYEEDFGASPQAAVAQLIDEAQEEREAYERTKKEERAKWERLSHAFDDIDYTDWQYVIGNVDVNLGEQLRETSLMGSSVSLNVDALEKIAEKILAAEKS